MGLGGSGEESRPVPAGAGTVRRGTGGGPAPEHRDRRPAHTHSQPSSRVFFILTGKGNTFGISAIKSTLSGSVLGE